MKVEDWSIPMIIISDSEKPFEMLRCLQILNDLGGNAGGVDLWSTCAVGVEDHPSPKASSTTP